MLKKNNYNIKFHNITKMLLLVFIKKIEFFLLLTKQKRTRKL